jgi:hypothetical protein
VYGKSIAFICDWGDEAMRGTYTGKSFPLMGNYYTAGSIALL